MLKLIKVDKASIFHSKLVLKTTLYFCIVGNLSGWLYNYFVLGFFVKKLALSIFDGEFACMSQCSEKRSACENNIRYQPGVRF